MSPGIMLGTVAPKPLGFIALVQTPGERQRIMLMKSQIHHFLMHHAPHVHFEFNIDNRWP